MSEHRILCLVAFAVVLPGCEQSGGHKARLERLESGMASLEHEVRGLQIDLDEAGRAALDAPLLMEQAAGACFEAVDTIVRNDRGSDCETFEWELAPASRKCVAQCDEAARYEESVASGQAKCEQLCAARECPRSAFSPPERCETVRCFPDYARCERACSTFNSCYLVHERRPWNCRCLEL